MKSILCLCFLFSCLFVCGQNLKIVGPPSYPCTDTLLQKETVFLCGDNKTYGFQNFRASFENNQFFLTASRPDSNTLFPLLTLFVSTKGETGIYTSEKQASEVYGTFRPGGANDFSSNVHNGSCQIAFTSFTSEYVKGHFVITAFDPWGSKGKQISGSFYVKLKKD